MLMWTETCVQPGVAAAARQTRIKEGRSRIGCSCVIPESVSLHALHAKNMSVSTQWRLVECQSRGGNDDVHLTLMEI
jgi:hypothetical protein